MSLQQIRPPTPADNLRRAYDAAERGWRVFPQRVNDGEKRPAIKDWPSQATADPFCLRDEWWGAGFGDCVPGIATGYQSACWVLDIDVHTTEANGFESLRKLCADNGTDVAELEGAAFRVRTPSGGQHWYFRYPDDVQVGNHSGRNGLAPGLDTRGEGGQVVAPGSRVWCHDGWRGYEVISNVEPLNRAPAWLERLAGPRTQEVVRLDASLAGRLATDDGYRGYCRRVLQREAEGLARAEEGGRNGLLNRAAYAVAGLAVWGGLTEQDAFAALMQACQANGLVADDGVDQCTATFKSGWSKGLVTPRRLPEQFAQAITQSERPKRMIFETGKAIRNRPPLSWVIEDVLPERALFQIFGQTGVYKTFVVLDMLGAVANGTPWLGKPVNSPGLAFLILGEGGGDIGERWDAWVQGHPGLADERVLFSVEQGLNLLEKNDVDEIIESITTVSSELAVPSRLVVFDTQADHMPGANEDKSSEFTMFKLAMQRISKETDAAVGTVHHTGWDDSRERGSSRQRQSLDVVMQVRDRSVTAVKVKASRLFEPIRFTTEEIGSSLTVRPATTGEFMAEASQRHDLALRSHVENICRRLAEITDDTQRSQTRLTSYLHINKETFQRAIDRAGDRIRVGPGRNGGNWYWLNEESVTGSDRV